MRLLICSFFLYLFFSLFISRDTNAFRRPLHFLISIYVYFRFKDEPNGADTSSVIYQEAVAKLWMKELFPVFNEAMTSPNRSIRLNAGTYFVPQTLDTFPEVLPHLIDYYSGKLSGGGGGAPASAIDLEAFMSVAKGGRACSLISGANLLRQPPSFWGADGGAALVIPVEHVARALQAEDDAMQMLGLGLICKALKSTEGVTDVEIELLFEHLYYNGAPHHVATRQQVVGFLKVFFVRLKSSWLSAKTACNSNERKLGALAEDHPAVPQLIEEMDALAETESALWKKLLRVVRTIQDYCVASLHPGAPHPRISMGIQILHMLLRCFKTPTSETGQQYKTASTAWPVGFPDLCCPRTTRVLLGAILNSHESVRTTVCAIIKDNYTEAIAMTGDDYADMPSPGEDNDNDGEDDDFPDLPDFPDFAAEPADPLGPPPAPPTAPAALEDPGALDLTVGSSAANAVEAVRSTAVALLARALELLRSPLVKESEAGSSLLKVVFIHYVTQHRMRFVLDADAVVTVVTVADGGSTAATTQEPDAPPELQFVALLAEQLGRQLDACRVDLRSVCRTRSIHGLISALKQSWAELIASDIAGQMRLQLIAMAASIVTQLLEVGDFALTLLVSASISGNGDFADLDTSLQTALSTYTGLHDPDETGAAGPEGSHPPIPGANDTLAEDKAFALSLAWRTLKEVGSFLGGAFNKALVQGVGFEQVGMIGSWFCKVLLSCRHKGVMESCADGLAAFCGMLSSCGLPPALPLMEQWLERCLTRSTETSAISVTRRSAGMPYVVRSILAHADSIDLITRTMDTLFITISAPLDGGWREIVDIPQVRGLNILNALFLDRGLTENLQPYVARALVQTIEGFGSPNWSIRNGCMRLLGTLTQRIFGMKKVQDDRSRINSIASRDFFARYPAMRPFLLEQLGIIVGRDGVDGESGAASVVLYPILTLFTKMQCSAEVDDVQQGLMRDYVPLLNQFLNHSSLAIRSLAARSIPPLYTLADSAMEATDWLLALAACRSGVAEDCDALPKSQHLKQPDGLVSANGVHGGVLCVQSFLRSWYGNATLDPAGLQTLVDAVSQASWLADPSQNPSAVTAALFVDVAEEFAQHLGAAGRRRLLDVLLPSGNVWTYDKTVIGEVWFRRAMTNGAFSLAVDGARLGASTAADLSTVLGALLGLHETDTKEITLGRLTQYFSADKCWTHPSAVTVAAISHRHCTADLLDMLRAPIPPTTSIKLCVEVLTQVRPRLKQDNAAGPPQIFLAGEPAGISEYWWAVVAEALKTTNVTIQEACLVALGLLVTDFVDHCTAGNDAAASTEAIDAWLRCIGDASDDDASTSLREAAAKSLAFGCGAVLRSNLMYDGTAGASPQGIETQFILLAVGFLHDESPDVRQLVSRAIAERVTGTGVADGLAGQPMWNLDRLLKLPFTTGMFCKWKILSKVLGATVARVTVKSNPAQTGALFQAEEANMFEEPAQVAHHTLMQLLQVANEIGAPATDTAAAELPLSAEQRGQLVDIAGAAGVDCARSVAQMLHALKTRDVGPFGAILRCDIITGRSTVFTTIAVSLMHLIGLTYSIGACQMAAATLPVVDGDGDAAEIDQAVTPLVDAIGIILVEAEAAIKADSLPLHVVQLLHTLGESTRFWRHPGAPSQASRLYAQMLAIQVATLSRAGPDAAKKGETPTAAAPDAPYTGSIGDDDGCNEGDANTPCFMVLQSMPQLPRPWGSSSWMFTGGPQDSLPDRL